MKKGINHLVEQDKTIITCKKLAKQLLINSKKQNINITLNQCQILVSQQLGYKNWFHLYHIIKNKYLTNDSLKQQPLLILWESILQKAIDDKATHIHISTKKNIVPIVMRVNGELYQQKLNDCSLIKIEDLIKFIHSSINPNKQFNDEENFNQVGVYYLHGKKININYSIIKSFNHIDKIYTEIFLKIESSELDLSSLIELGYSSDQNELLTNMIYNESGAILFSGSVFSGKNTSMSSFLKLIDSNSASKKKNLSVMAQSDFVLNDPSSDEKIINFLNNKHTLFLSTLHASSAINIVPRLMNEHMDFLLKVKTISFQELIPVNCPHCRLKIQDLKNENSKQLMDYTLLKKKYSKLNLSNITFRNMQGCKQCSFYGVSGMTVCAEVISIDKTISNLISKKELKQIHSYWKGLSDENILSEKMQGKTAKQHAIYKMLHGIIDPHELIKKFGNFEQ